MSLCNSSFPRGIVFPVESPVQEFEFLPRWYNDFYFSATALVALR